jgi:hypothetical protein
VILQTLNNFKLRDQLCFCDQSGLRFLFSTPHPAPSLLRRIGLVEETLAAKLEAVAKLAGKFLLEA